MDLKVGDYVLGAKWSDADPGDNWAVGFLNEIRPYPQGFLYFVGNDDTHSFRVGGFRHCKRIPEDVGSWLLENAKTLEESPPGSINLFKMIDTERNNDFEDEDQL